MVYDGQGFGNIRWGVLPLPPLDGVKEDAKKQKEIEDQVEE